MGAWQRLLVSAAAILALVCAAAPRALASTTQESILLDDEQLIYSTPGHMHRTLQQLASLGVDRVKASVVWSLVAPKAASTRRPHFNASDPAAYPPGAWSRYDMLVRWANALGLKVYFQFVPNVPLWAVPPHTPDQGPPLGRVPDTRQFRQFVTAAGRRYSGTYGGADPLPRVDYWGIWNEPNERSWLNPWYRSLGNGQRALIQPMLYRGLVDAGWNGLSASGHKHDTILIGETANRGIWAPVPFLQAVYCEDSSYRPLTGQTAALLGCADPSNPSAFVAGHPGLFYSSGLAHHPYSFDVAPNQPYPDPTFMTLYNLPTLEGAMNRIVGAYGQTPRGGVPLYLTEWGYKTRPPNPFSSTSPTNQATWLNEGYYMAWAYPFVRAIAQFLLVDSPPKPHTPTGSRSYWSTFQTGLVNLSGTRKPSYDAFRIPIWLPDPRHGSRVTVWGQLRPADHTAAQSAVLEFQASGARTWKSIRVIQTASPRGFLVAHVPLSSAGQVRLAWQNPRSDRVYYSRTVAVG